MIGLPWRAALLVWGVSLCVYAGYFQAQWAFGERPIYHITGDEPHYLVIATSVLKDRDLDIHNNYRDKDYHAFYPFHLGDARDPEDMHALYGRGGRLYSKHGIGLPVMLLPAMALGGQGWATVFMMGVAALLSTQVLALALVASSRLVPALVAWVSVAFSPPLLLYAHQFYPEVPGALLTAAGTAGVLWCLRRGRAAWPALGAVTCALALLPWLHLRYVPLAAVVFLGGLYALWGDRSRPVHKAALAGVPLISAVCLLALNWRLFGGVPSVDEYGTVSLANALTGLPGLLFDRQFGLFPYAPVYITACAGILALPAALGRRRAVAALAPAAVYVALLASFSFWYGSFSPPARMLVPVAPLLVLPLAAALSRRRVVVAAHAVLMALTGAIAWLLATVPRLRYQLPNGESQLLVYLSGVWERDVTSWLPSFIAWSWASYAWIAGFLLACGAVFYAFARGAVRRGVHRRGVVSAPRRPATSEPRPRLTRV